MELNFKQLGSKNQPPMVILHGLFGMLDNWQTLGKKFAQDYCVYLIDQRNHGKSPHAHEFDYYEMADDLATFFEQQNINQAIVLGHSMGGKTAMQFAVDHPEKTKSLIVVDIAPKNYPPGHEIIFEGFFAVDLPRLASRRAAETALATKIEDRPVRQFLLKNLSRQKDGRYIWKCNLETIYQNYTNIIANSLGTFDQYEGETLFVKGALSPRYIEVEQDFPLIQRHFPKTSLKTISDSGHWIHAQQPKAFYQTVIEFLNSK